MPKSLDKLIRLIKSNHPFPLEEIDPRHLVDALFAIEMMEHFLDSNAELFPGEYPQTISTKKSETDPQP